MRRISRMSVLVRKYWPVAALVGLACLLASVTHGYAHVWRSDLALWHHAVQVAAQKPRPWVNYGAALAQWQRTAEAHHAWAIAGIVADLPHVPAWDTRATRIVLASNQP